MLFTLLSVHRCRCFLKRYLNAELVHFVVILFKAAENMAETSTATTDARASLPVDSTTAANASISNAPAARLL